MIYKMELSDDTDSMVFDLLEVPIIDNDVTGIASNTTIDGNVFNDYLWLKKQYVQKWSIMCKDEYEQLRGFWLRQFGYAKVPFYRLFYGNNDFEDLSATTSNGYAQVTNQTERTAPASVNQLLGNATQQTYSGKNKFNIDDLYRIYPSESLDADISGNTLTLTATGTTGAQYAGYIINGLDSTKTYTLSLKAKKVVKGTDGRPYIRVQTYGSTDSTNWTNLGYYENNNPTQGTEYSVSVTLTGYTYYRVYFYNNTNAPVTVGEKTQYYDIQLEEGSTATDYEPYVGGVASPNPDYPQDIQVVTGDSTVKITGKNLFNRATAYENSGLTWAYGIPFTEQKSISSADYTPVSAGQEVSLNYKAQIMFYDSSKTYLGALQNDGTSLGKTQGTTSRRFIVPSGYGIAYVRFGFRTGVNDSLDLTQQNIMVNFGSNFESYEPYKEQSYVLPFGDTYLAKIGDYIDEPVKVGDTWYIRRAIGKVVLDGSESESWSIGQNHYYHPLADAVMPSGPNVMSPVISDYYAPSSYADLFYARVDYGVALHNTTNRLIIRNKDIATVADFKTWLSTHNTTVYYALATPTDEEITDEELLGELNAIGELYSGQNNIWLIPSAGAQGELALDYRLIYDEEVDIIPQTPVVLTLTDGGVINPCECRQNIQLTMRETKESSES